MSRRLVRVLAAFSRVPRAAWKRSLSIGTL
jgi:hypothetical protein